MKNYNLFNVKNVDTWIIFFINKKWKIGNAELSY